MNTIKKVKMDEMRQLINQISFEDIGDLEKFIFLVVGRFPRFLENEDIKVLFNKIVDNYNYYWDKYHNL